MLEFLLVNHPVDCPICDQAGECPLQDQYFKYDRRPSRVGDPVRKVKKAKHVRVGPRVTLDQERCVLCTRCVRFMDEVAGEPQLGMFWRNDHAYIDTFPGQPLTSNYSLNTVAICPVGALTSTDFRFKKRVWNLRSAPTLCNGCARGCNAWVDKDRDSDRIYRYRARENPAVNRVWMCDEGFLSYKEHNEGRVLAAREGRGGAARVGRSYEVARHAAERLAACEKADLAVLVSACCSTEDALATARVARDVLGLSCLYLGGREDGEPDRILLRADRNPNRLGVQIVAEAFGLELKPFEALLEAVDAGGVKVLWAVGTEVPVDAAMAAGVLSSLDFACVQAHRHDPLTEVADVVLPAATHAEYDGTYVNFMGRLQRFWQVMEPRGEAAAHWDWVTEIAGLMDAASVPDYYDSDEVFRDLAPKVPVLAGIEWEEIDAGGVALEGVGQPEDQTGGRGEREVRGVSRWPR